MNETRGRACCCDAATSRQAGPEALELHVADRLERRAVSRRFAGPRSDERGARCGGRLQARSDVHACPDGHALSIGLRGTEVDKRVPGLDTDPDRHGRAALGGRRGLRETARRGAEDDEDRVTDVFLDGPALGRHLGRKVREAAVEHALHPLGAERDELRGTDDVDEHRGDEPPLGVALRHGLLPGRPRPGLDRSG
jgi:hypothetical protein